MTFYYSCQFIIMLRLQNFRRFKTLGDYIILDQTKIQNENYKVHSIHCTINSIINIIIIHQRRGKCQSFPFGMDSTRTTLWYFWLSPGSWWCSMASRLRWGRGVAETQLGMFGGKVNRWNDEVIQWGQRFTQEKYGYILTERGLGT